MLTFWFALVAACICVHVASLAAPWPAVTALQPINPRGWTPVPTEGPKIPLNKRIPPGSFGPSSASASTSVNGLHYGQICGYELGQAQYPIGCIPGYQCCYNSIFSVVGCCGYPFKSYTIATTCVGYSDHAGSLLSSSFNALTYYCTDRAYPYCLTQYFQENGYSFINCGNAKGFSSVEVLLSSTLSSSASSSSNNNNKSLNKLRSKLKHLSQQINHPPKSSASLTGPNAHTTSVSSAASSSQRQASGHKSGGGGGGGSSTPIGAIVGGAVGGVAVIAIILFLVWFVLRKKKKDKTAPAQGPGQPQMGYTSPEPSGYDPRYSQYTAATATSASYSPQPENKSPFFQGAQPVFSTPPPGSSPAPTGYTQQYPVAQSPGGFSYQQPSAHEVDATPMTPTMSNYSEMPQGHSR